MSKRKDYSKDFNIEFATPTQNTSDKRFRHVNNSENTPHLSSVSIVKKSVPVSSVFNMVLSDITNLGDNTRNNKGSNGSSSSSLTPKSG